MNSRQRFEKAVADKAKSTVALDSRDKAIISAIATAVNLPANKLQGIYDDAQLKLNTQKVK